MTFFRFHLILSVYSYFIWLLLSDIFDDVIIIIISIIDHKYNRIIMICLTIVDKKLRKLFLLNTLYKV